MRPVLGTKHRGHQLFDPAGPARLTLQRGPCLCPGGCRVTILPRSPPTHNPEPEATPVERPQSPHKATWQETEVPSDCSQAVSHFVNCTVNSYGGCLDHMPAEGERRQPAEAVGPKPLSQQPTSPKLCSLSLVCRENTASSLPTGFTLTSLSDIRPEGGQGSNEVTHSVLGCAFSRIYRGREGQ